MMIDLGDTRFPFTQIRIDFDQVQRYQELTPRRICFSTTHKNALRRSGQSEYFGSFTVPFEQTIEPIFYAATRLQLYLTKYYNKYWRSIVDEDEFNAIKEFIKGVRGIVFLRDTLSLSIALSEHIEGNERTEVGEWEYQAKYSQNEEAINSLTQLCSVAIQNRLPYYKEADMICSVPPTRDKNFHLPERLGAILSSQIDIEDISSNLSWTKPKQSLKNLSIEAKWTALEKAGLLVDTDLSGKTVIILDDLYQSGITMQYVAMKLQEAGADKLFGLALVKSRRDTDNQ